MKKFLLLLNLVFLAYPINRLLSTEETATVQQEIDNCTTEIEILKNQIGEILGLTPNQLVELYENSKVLLEININQIGEDIKIATNAQSYKINTPILKNFGNIEFYVCNNLESLGIVGAAACGSIIFIDKNYINNMGVILHELGHTVYCDSSTKFFMHKLIDSNTSIEEDKKNKALELANQIQILKEKRADFFAKMHGYKYSHQISSFLKATENKCCGSFDHPETKERLEYLSNNQKKN